MMEAPMPINIYLLTLLLTSIYLGFKLIFLVLCPFWHFLPALWRSFFYAVWNNIIICKIAQIWVF